MDHDYLVGITAREACTVMPRPGYRRQGGLSRPRGHTWGPEERRGKRSTSWLVRYQPRTFSGVKRIGMV
jgi:hypothetical protein